MLSETVKQQLLKKIIQDVEVLWGSLESIAQTPGTGLGEMEARIEQGGRVIFGGLLQALAQQIATQTPLVCPDCQKPLQRDSRGQRRTIRTVAGEITLLRDYGWCPHCKRWHHPADRRMGLDKSSSVSPRMAEIATLLTLKMPAAQAEEISERTSGIRLSRCGLHREARRQGDKARRLMEHTARQTQSAEGVRSLTAPDLPGQSPFTLVIQMDAFHIRERDEWGNTERLLKRKVEFSRWHWVYAGTCYRLDHCAKTASGREIISQRGYVATRMGLEYFEELLYAEALQRGLRSAERVVVIADGAIWIWNIAKERYSYAAHRLDLWHLNEHLWEIAHDIYGHTSQAEAWVRPLLRQIKSKASGAIKTIESLQELRSQIPSEQRKALDKQIDYLQANQHRMDYADAQKRQEPLGSGAIESTCKQYQCRFKRSGQFWSLQGDESLLALETLYRNQRWHLLFPHSKITNPGPSLN